MQINGSLRYRVYFTPILQDDESEYGEEIDVSDKVFIEGVGSIAKSIDAADYDIGVFTFSDLELSAWNYNGYFNEMDTRSIFPSTRDRCKVRVVFEKLRLTRANAEGTVSESDLEEVVTYRGLINEEATRLDIVTEKIRFKVLSRDSVLRTTKVSGGVINNGDLISEAILKILNVPRITSVLTISALNIDPDLDIEVDVGGEFDNRSVKDSLDDLLFASNSCMLIDDAGIVYVRNRAADLTRPVLNLFGQYDEQKRENIVDITAYNTGKQRNFTSVVINETERSNSTYVLAFGLRQKRFSLPWITDAGKETEIADRLVNEFKVPKIELNVKVATDLVKSVELLDRVSINYPNRIEPVEGTFLPVVGITKIDDSNQPLPYIFGSIEISPNIAFKVIEITHSPENMTSILKLRQDGTDFDDGYYTQPGSCIVGFAKIDDGTICAGGDPCERFTTAPLGAAVIDCSVIQP